MSGLSHIFKDYWLTMCSTGPRKLAKVFGIAFRRWIDLQAVPVASTLTSSESNSEQIGSSASSGSPGTLRRTDSPATEVSEDWGENTKALADDKSASPQPPTLPSGPGPRRDFPGYEPCDIGRPRVIDKVGLRFLLVDDNHINLKILVSYAKKLGRQYETATNGREALDAYLMKPEQYCCIFMDISMPVMDGFEATRRIRSFEHEWELKPVTIFALTGLASANAQQEAAQSGIDLFVTKPVRLKELGRILVSRELL